MKTIFVSSTFKDMHFERDAIQEITLPLLKREAQKYGDNVHFCDLRWGINTCDLDSEDGSRKVLDVCLDAIDRCRPPMVVILGDRYGWIPSEELTASVADRKNIDRQEIMRRMQLEDLRISVTALEIAYGAIATAEKRQSTLFYFRTIESESIPEDFLPEDDEHAKKLAALKARLYELCGGRIKNYTVRWNGSELWGVDAFAKMLAQDIGEIIIPEWKAASEMNGFSRELAAQLSFIREKNSAFSIRSGTVDELYKKLTQCSERPLALTAESGSGKSMIFCNLALRLISEGYDVLPIVCGLTSRCTGALDILRIAIYWLEELLSLPHTSDPFDGKIEDAFSDMDAGNRFEKLKEYYVGLCRKCTEQGRRIFIMLDAVDSLIADEYRASAAFMPETSDCVGFFMTCTPSISSATCDTFRLSSIDSEEKKSIIRSILHSHGRELGDEVIARMIESDASDNPLYLNLLVLRLMMMNREDFVAIRRAGDGIDAITARQLEIIDSCPDSLMLMSAELLSEAGARINEELVSAVAQYLAVSRFGLREEDLSSLLGEKWNALDFAHFVTYMSESFIRRDDGRFDFSHKCIREGFLGTCGDTAELHRRIISHLAGLPDGDPLKEGETVYHCFMADDADSFISYIESCGYGTERYKLASAETFSCTMADGGDWLCSVLNNGRKSYLLSNFISSCFIYGMPAELEIAKRVLAANLDYAEENREEFSSAVLSLAYNNFAYVCENIGGSENLHTALTCYYRSLELIKELATELPDADLREEVSIRRLNYGHALIKYGGISNYNAAIESFAESISINKELYSEEPDSVTRALNLTNVYDQMGELMSAFATDDNRWRAEEYLNASLEIKKGLCGKISDVDYRDGLASSYALIAGLLHSRAGIGDFSAEKGNDGKAIEYLENARTLIHNNYMLTRRTSYPVLEMDILVRLGNIRINLLSLCYDNQMAKKHFGDAITIYGELSPEIITDRNSELFAYALSGYALAITEAKEKDSYQEALDMYEKAIAIMEKISEKYRTAPISLQLITILSNCALLCHRMNNSAATSAGIAYGKRAEAIIKEIESSGNLPADFGSRSAALYNNMLNLYTKQLRIDKCVVYTVKATEAVCSKYFINVESANAKLPNENAKPKPQIKKTIGNLLLYGSFMAEALMLLMLLIIGDFDMTLQVSVSLVWSAIWIYVGAVLAEKRLRFIDLLFYVFGTAAVWGIIAGILNALL